MTARSASLRAEIFPADLDRTVDFYTRALGFVVDRDERADAAPYVALSLGDIRIGAARRDPVADAGARRPPTGVELVLETADLDEAMDRVRASGWPIEEDLRTRPWGLRDFRVLDPDGYYLRVTEMATEH